MSQEGGKALVFLYRRLLRSAATYPSRNRWGIYQAIREEFKENRNLDPTTEDTKKKNRCRVQGIRSITTI